MCHVLRAPKLNFAVAESVLRRRNFGSFLKMDEVSRFHVFLSFKLEWMALNTESTSPSIIGAAGFDGHAQTKRVNGNWACKEAGGGCCGLRQVPGMGTSR